jgi:hypothetical protein
MTAINSLTHIKSIHTNTELGSKHIRKICGFVVGKNMFSSYIISAKFPMAKLR